MGKLKKTMAIVVSVTMLFAGCGAGQEAASAEASEQPTEPVVVTKVASETIKREMVYAGQVTPLDSVSVVSKITGKVEEYYFDVGDEVKAGDPLFKLNEEDIHDQITQLTAQLNQADQAVRTARNALSSVTGGTYQSEIINQESAIEGFDTSLANADRAIATSQTAVDNAKKSLDLAQKAFDDTKALFEAEAVSQAAFDEVEFTLIQAQAGYDQAKSGYEQAIDAKEQLTLQKNTALEGLDLTKGTITQENTQRAQLGVDSAVAARNIASVSLQLTRETLEDTLVTSPIDGIVSVRNANTDEYVNPQVPAFTIINMDKVYVDVKVSELLINTLSPGKDVEVVINSLFEESLMGKVKTVSPAADATGTFPVQIELDNSEGHLIKPGMFAEVRFVKEISENTVVLPRNTVLDDDTGVFVYINDGGKAKKTMVETGIDNGEYIEITSGVNVGDEVITTGQVFVADGDSINVVSAVTE